MSDLNKLLSANEIEASAAATNQVHLAGSPDRSEVFAAPWVGISGGLH
jgi:hypothetical protein